MEGPQYSASSFETADNLRRLNVSRYLSFASLAILLYDHALTFDQEVRHAWKADRSFVNCLFLVNRYLTPLVVLINVLSYSDIFPPVSFDYCRIFAPIQHMWSIIMFGSSYHILSRRVLAIHGSSKAIKWFVHSVSTVVICAVIVACILSLRSGGGQSGPEILYFSAFKTCYRLPLPTDWIDFFAPIVLDTVLFALVVNHAWKLRSTAILRLTHVLWRDGAIWFCIMIVTLGVNTILYARFRFTMIAMDNVAYVACQTATSRLFFNLRAAARQMGDSLPDSLPEMDMDGNTVFAAESGELHCTGSDESVGLSTVLSV